MKTVPLGVLLPGTALIYTALQPFSLSPLIYLPLTLLGVYCLINGRKATLSFGGLLLFLVLSMGIYRRSTAVYLPFPAEDCVRLKGRLTAEPSWNSRGNLIFTLEMEELEQHSGAQAAGKGSIRVSLSEQEAFSPESWLRGDSVDLEGRFTVDGTLFFGKSLLVYESTGPGRFRRWIVNRVHRKAEALSEFSASLLPALVLGLKHPDQDRSSALFRETGTAHIIALSGFHSGLVALLLYLLFKRPAGHRGALVLSALGLLVYLYLAGPKPSLIRSVLMYQIIILCKLKHVRPDLKKVLAASYLVSALICPASLHTLSARLSYLALWGILSGSTLLAGVLPMWIPLGLRTALGASMAAQLWTLPLVLFSFGVWYPAGLAASLVLTPLVTLYMYSGILYLFLPDLSLLTALPVLLCRILEKMMVFSAGFFVKIPSLSLTEPGPGLFLLLLFPLLLGVIYAPGRLSWKKRIWT